MLKRYLTHNLTVLLLLIFSGLLYLLSNNSMQKNLIVLGTLLLFVLLNALYHKYLGKINTEILLEYTLIASILYLIYLLITLF